MFILNLTSGSNFGEYYKSHISNNITCLANGS